MYNCPTRCYTVVDEMFVDEMFVDELSCNLLSSAELIEASMSASAALVKPALRSGFVFRLSCQDEGD